MQKLSNSILRFALIAGIATFLNTNAFAQAKTAFGVGPVFNHYTRTHKSTGRKKNDIGLGGMLQVELKLTKIISLVPSVGLELPYTICPGVGARIYTGKSVFFQVGGFASPGGDDGVYIGVGANAGIGVCIPVAKAHTVDLSLRVETFNQNEPENNNHTYFTTGLRALYVFGRSKK